MLSCANPSQLRRYGSMKAEWTVTACVRSHASSFLQHTFKQSQAVMITKLSRVRLDSRQVDSSVPGVGGGV